MSEETWYKMLAVSFALHILVVAAFSIPFKSTKRKIDLSSSYSVNLVGGVGGGGGGQKEAANAGSEKDTGKTRSRSEGNKTCPCQKQTHSDKERRPRFTLKEKGP